MNQYNNIPSQQGLAMEEPVKVSVIVPVYNQGEFLAEALDSVLQQTYPKWECVIVNDGSTDNSGEVAKGYVNKDDRFKYLYQDNSGVAAARNNGIRHSDAFFILPLDGDDVLCPSYLEKAVNRFLLHPETTLVYGKTEFLGDRSGGWNLPEYSWDSFIWSNCIVNCAMYKRSDFEKTKGYQDNILLEDWDFWLTLLNPESVVYRYDDVLFKYRVRKSSRNSLAEKDYENAAVQIYQNHKDVYEPYHSKILYFAGQRLEYLKYKEGYSEAITKYDGIASSKAYRYGKKILRPFSWLKTK